MDDGGRMDYKDGKGMVLNTQGFTEIEVKRMNEELMEKLS